MAGQQADSSAGRQLDKMREDLKSSTDRIIRIFLASSEGTVLL